MSKGAFKEFIRIRWGQWLARRLERANHLDRVERAGRRGAFGPVVAQLRARAWIFEIRAFWVLAALLAVVAAGLVFYLYRPILQNENEMERRIHEQTVELKQRDLGLLNKRRTELQSQIAERVAVVFVARQVENVSVTLFDVRFGPQGEAVIVGKEGTILTRDPGETAWSPHSVDGVSADLYEVRFGPQGEGVIVGLGGTILTRAPGESAWSLHPVDRVSAHLYEVRFGPQGEAVIVGDQGTILTRDPGETAWSPLPVDGVSVDLYDVRFGPQGEAVIVGLGGTILTRDPGETTWSLRPIDGVSADLYDARFGPQGEAVIVGEGGTILTRDPGETAWTPQPVDGVSADLYDVRFGPQGEAVIVGLGGTILTRDPGETVWSLRPVDGVSADLYDVRFGPQGEAVIVGLGGTILTRDPGETAWNSRPVDGISVPLFDVRFGPQGEAVIVGDQGTIIETTRAFSQEIAAALSDEQLRKALSELPEIKKQPLEGERLSAIEAERKRATKDLEEAQANIAEADLGTLSRRQRLDDFNEHMLNCVPLGSDAAMVTACGEAYERIIVQSSQQSWWELLAEVVPPAILLLFLLVTLGGLYRYNLRMAGFYHGRADALELRKNEFDKESFELLVAALAADQVEFKASKTPIDQVTEITKAIIAKTGPRSDGPVQA